MGLLETLSQSFLGSHFFHTSPYSNGIEKSCDIVAVNSYSTAGLSLSTGPVKQPDCHCNNRTPVNQNS